MRGQARDRRGKVNVMWKQHVPAVLVIDGQRDARAELRGLLEAERYEVTTAPTTAVGFDILRTSSDRMVVLCAVACDDASWGTDSGLRQLGALARDARLARGHDYILLAERPEQVCASLGSLPAHVTVSMVRTPFDVARLLDAIEAARDLAPMTVDAGSRWTATA
jgi:CheY-like chemotaxis protein